MTSARLAVVLGAVLVTLSSADAVAGGRDGPALRTDPEALGMLEDALATVRQLAFDATLVVVAFDTHGPSVLELDVSQAEGDLRVSRGERWTLGRSESHGYFQRAGELLQLGSVAVAQTRRGELNDKYVVRSGPKSVLDTGEASVVEVIERASQQLRERLYVDHGTDVVIRRETFGADVEPVRLVAFTEFRLRAEPMRGFEAPTAEERGLETLSEDSLDLLSDVGWEVPDELPAGFELQGGFTLPESEGGSVHLVYSDGLYTLSLYEQVGRLDPDSLGDAVQISTGDVHAYRWPGAEPERMVWSGDGLTFTIVTDAPEDAVMQAASGLPGGEAQDTRGRMVRGLKRVADWLWPFG